jgi:hypothetical protein
MAAEMRRDDGQGYNGDIYLGYHSNAFNGTARGNVALITNSGGTPTNQAAYATLVADEHDLDCLVEDANWENVWIDRVSATLTSAYGEISNGNLGGEMCGTIIEVAFHDNALDAELLRDPKVRNVMGRSHYQAILQYFNQFDSASLVYLPEPPVNFRAINQGNGDITLSWSPGPSGQPGGDAATGYRVYVSTDGLGFTLHSTTAGTSATLTGLPADQPHYFRVTATNAGGESLPTESLAARVQSGSPAPTLIVNGYDRIDRNNNIEEYPANLEDDENERIHLHRNNSYNYVIAHAEAIDAFGRNFDSCANEAVITGAVDLTDYDTVVWILGEESTTDSTFNPTEQTQVTNFLNGGGNLFLTGAEIGWDLDAQGNGVSFFENTLHANYVGDDGGTYAAGGAVGSIFEGIALSFDDGTFVYDVDFPDRLVANGAGATVAMNYIGGTNDGAAIQFSGGSPTRRVVMLGFPFETIIDVTDRNAVMAAVLDFFGTPVPVGISLIGVE